jgi:hypothetical protein
MVGKEAIDELSYGICKKKHGADDTKLLSIERSAVDDRLLDHVKTCAAHIVKAITYSSSEEGLEAQPTELCVLNRGIHLGL